MTPKPKCCWPGCIADGFVSSGNVAGAIVCRDHFDITNGKKQSELTEYERGVIETLHHLFLRAYPK